MKKEKLFKAISNADDSYIKEANPEKMSFFAAKRGIIIKCASVAACFCLVGGVILSVPSIRNSIAKYASSVLGGGEVSGDTELGDIEIGSEQTQGAIEICPVTEFDFVCYTPDGKGGYKITEELIDLSDGGTFTIIDAAEKCLVACGVKEVNVTDGKCENVGAYDVTHDGLVSHYVGTVTVTVTLSGEGSDIPEDDILDALAMTMMKNFGAAAVNIYYNGELALGVVS